ncbi:MAG TPA: galactose mutarotase [Candidatus Blautia faecigallinarum]|uniref:Aldose 1-epimerase n=1 Tax=Candidatus Blautia faecigallinarum TaxID=2838488 RepID=A0A9D2IUU8_9FIRM|nr:galactose mutarotase [Candidatus Blautia faecigallinarum]
MSITERKFGELKTGEPVRLFHLENASGAYAEVLDYGALLVKVCVPDQNGKLLDVVLGYDDLKSYEKNGCFFGAVIGRSGNRIEGGRFQLDGQEYVLAKNENDNNLHSGPDGFEKKMWKVEECSEKENSITLGRLSPDGENGFPGDFHISVKYEFTEDNELKITYQGESDKTTIANLTNHSYFNLSGEGSGDILDHFLTIHGSYYTPVRDSASIPTGVYEEVAGTPMDFTKAKRIGEEIDADFQQLVYTGGYDHNYVTDHYAKGNVRLIASAYSPVTGIAMDVASDCPCVQFYAGNFVHDEKGKNGHIYGKRDGFCLETQVEPNAVNTADFHSPVLRAGETYRSVTSYRFYIKK